MLKCALLYQLATPPFVIHIFVPLITHSFPFFSALVLIPATSEPAPGSVTQYACVCSHNTLFNLLQINYCITQNIYCIKKKK